MNYERKLTGLEVAVIGMSLRVPGAENVDQFWYNLKNGVESVKKFSDEELLRVGVTQEILKNPAYVKSASYVKDKEYFDSKFFGYRPEEANLMNPQTRLFHQCVWEALEDSGYVPDRYDGMIGLYAGAKSDTNWENYSLLYNSNTQVDEFSARIFRKVDYFCSSIAYKLNLKGPAVSLNTACSTSLVAIHTAVMSLLTGENNIALAGGITLTSYPPEGYIYKEGMINSPDGHCRAFDEKGNGIVPAEGAGVVVLKKLDNALRDGDHIYAIIKGSAVNNDGSRKVGYTSPAVSGQANVIRAAQIMSRVKPESISYIEAHGTGTALGDTVEIEALSQAFGKSKNKYCAIGSVKSNIGHTDSAAGIVGFIKTVLALKHRQIPPTLHFKKINSKINLEDTPFTINSELKEWKSEKYPLRAGVSSFGIGGTNAHVILEEALQQEECKVEKKSELLVLSAKTSNSLKNMISKYTQFFKDRSDVNLADLAWTLQTGRDSFPYRFKLVAKNVQEAMDILLAKELDKTEIIKLEQTKKSIAFMFSAEGSQYVNMGRGIYEEESVFREKMDQCFSILSGLMTVDIKEILYPTEVLLEDATVKINEPQYLYPALFSVEYALASLMDTWGVKPDYMVGNGIGEYVAACIGGLFSLEDTLRLMVRVGELIENLPKGAMLEIAASEEVVLPLLSGELSVAIVKSTENCVISGTVEAVEQFQVKAEKNGWNTARMPITYALHSNMLETVSEKFVNEVKNAKFNKPSSLWISSMSGKMVNSEEVMLAEYWRQQLLRTVQMFKSFETILQDDRNCMFIEVGPSKDFVDLTQNKLKQALGNCTVLNLMLKPKEGSSDMKLLLEQMGELWLKGINLKWEMFHWKEKRRKISAPVYCFEKKVYPIGKNMNHFFSKELVNLLKNDKLNNSISVQQNEVFFTKENSIEERIAPKDMTCDLLTNTEKVLVEIWREFFDIEEIGKDDNFFDIGGESLRAIGLATLIKEKLDIEISIEDLFSLTTVAEMAKYIDSEFGDKISVHKNKESLTKEDSIEELILHIDETNDSLTSTEKSLIDIWKEFFDIEEVGKNDNFFDIGGDSLRAMGLATLIEEKLEIEIPIENLFSLTTVAEMAKYIDYEFGNRISVHQKEEGSTREDSIVKHIKPIDKSNDLLPSTEEILDEIWKEFFDIEEVERDDNFYDIGGDSLRAMGLATIIEEKLNIEIPIENLFSLTTIEEMAKYIDSEKGKDGKNSVTNEDDDKKVSVKI